MQHASTLPKELPNPFVNIGPEDSKTSLRQIQKAAKFSIEPGHRRAVNDRLQESRPGHACPVLFPNAKTPGAEKPRQRLIVVKLPRSSSGRPPRRGVHIPLSSYAAVVANTCITSREVQGPKFTPAKIKRIKRRPRK